MDAPFASAFRVRGAPGLSPGVLCLVTVLQFAEDLTDRQAAAMAVWAIDWKYVVGAELTGTDFDASVLSQFRSRLADTAWNGWSSTVSLSTAVSRGWSRPGASSGPIPPM